MSLKRHVLAVGLVLLATSGPVLAQTNDPTMPDRDQAATAPPGHEVVRHGLGGSYFAPKDLRTRYEELLARVEDLRQGLERPESDPAAASPRDAAAELATIETQLSVLQGEIERRTVFVSPYTAHTQTTVFEVPLDDSRLVVLTTDAVTLRGWEGPGIRVTLDKTVLWPTAAGTPPDSEFAALTFEHDLGPQPDLVGRTAEQWAIEEAKFLASPAGKALTPEQSNERAKFVGEIRDSWAPYARFQGKPLHAISVTGLTHDEGNLFIGYDVKSPDGGGAMGGDWRRHAKLTVELPPIDCVLVRGCEVGFDIRGVVGDVILSTQGSHDRDYDGTFVIDGVTGSLTTHQVPLDAVRHVTGDVAIAATTVMLNSGTTHGPEGRRAYAPPPRPTTVSDVGGRLTATFVRSELTLAGVTSLDVVNEYGPTRLVLEKPVAAGAHRLLSRSGSIDVRATPAVWKAGQVRAFTEVGHLDTDLSQAEYEVTNFGSPAGRSWRSLTPVAADGGSLAFFERSRRPGAVVDGGTRSDGLDVLSHAGTVVLRTLTKEE